VTRRHVAEETPARWPLSISSFTQVLELLDGTRWTRPAGRGPGRGAGTGGGKRGGAAAPRRPARRRRP
jgi:hypothetical protein